MKRSRVTPLVLESADVGIQNEVYAEGGEIDIHAQFEKGAVIIVLKGERNRYVSR